jgi:transposase-like protein
MNGAPEERMCDGTHHAIKRRSASTAGFKSFDNAAISITGIELAHRINKLLFSFGAGRLEIPE